ncbi:MAG: secreted Zn-dependent insulinase-like peptidase [Oceanicoccus sp.]|jgi:secreted Zn-dependent insulinase-like peptidase
MLFLGTDKYPVADEYQSFISSHGGSHNAYTAFEHTNYFFDIDPNHFAAALDRFSRFFVAPLFTTEYVAREKNAVHSEYKAKIKDEYRKSADIFKTLVNPAHPFSKFSVGNLETLASKAGSNVDLRGQLLQFYQQYYSASIMNLVVLGREPLPELEKMVRLKFSAVTNNDYQNKSVQEPLFKAGVLPLSVSVKPEKTLRSLSVVFPTANDITFYQQKPLHFIGNILGHEGSGSLLSYLKKRGWVEGLSAGQGLAYQGGATFNINIMLTEQGVTHADDITIAVFQAINRIKNDDQRGWLFDEQKALAAQQFRFQQKTSAMNYVMSLSSVMHDYPIADVLQSGYLMTDYDSEIIDRFLDDMVPANSIVTLTAPDVATDKVSYFYQADYKVVTTSTEQLTRWTEAGIEPEITLPAANQFIATDLKVLPANKSGKLPQLIRNSAGLKFWYKQATAFPAPRGSLSFSIHSPIASDTAEHRALQQLFVAMVNDELNEMSYAATLAGLNYSMSTGGQGITVKISGFNHKQAVLLDKLIETLKNPAFSPERFENIKREHLRQLRNYRKQQPYRQLMSELPELLYPRSWGQQPLLAAYQNIDLSSLQQYRQQLLSSVTINALVYGNFSGQQASGFADQLAIGLLTEAENLVPTAVPVEVVQLAEQQFLRQLPSDYNDASVMLYLQAGGLEKSRRAAMGVSAQALKADFYTRLRTEKQLGYIVTSGAYPQRDVPGMFFLVQSPVAGSKKLAVEIDGFLAKRLANIEDFSEQQFQVQRAAVLTGLREAPQNLWQQSERYWQNISQNYQDFDLRQQLIVAAENLTFAQWQTYFLNDVVNNPRRIMIYTVGQFEDQQLVGDDRIENAESFKLSQQRYRFQ